MQHLYVWKSLKKIRKIGAPLPTSFYAEKMLATFKGKRFDPCRDPHTTPLDQPSQNWFSENSTEFSKLKVWKPILTGGAPNFFQKNVFLKVTQFTTLQYRKG